MLLICRIRLNARLGGSNSHASTSPVMLELQTQPYMIIGMKMSSK